MGQIVRRKRKGKHSNKTDRAHSPAAPVDRRSSGRRRRNVRYNFDINDYVDDDEFYNDEDVDIGRRQKKKIKLLLSDDVDDDVSRRRVYHAPPVLARSSSEDENDSDDDDGDEYDRIFKKKRKVVDDDFGIEKIREGNVDEDDEEEEEEVEGSDYDRGKESDLRDKNTLEVILDKLQKKDIYGVYAAPVDPDELPDYYDVIKHPMDFATVRKKLAKGLYLTLKEFESDVLLICTNAMQYNAPDTIYYKQASSIQEQAKLRFQRLRSNVDRSEIEPRLEQKTLPSFSLPKKQLKKSVALNAEDPVSSGYLPIGRREVPNGLSAKNRAGSGSLSGSMDRTGEAPNGSSAKNHVGSETFSGSVGKTGEALNGSSAKKHVGSETFSSSIGSKGEVPRSSSAKDLVASETFSGSIGRTGEVPKNSSAKDPVGSETLFGSVGRTGEVSKGLSANNRVGSETLSGSIFRARELPSGSSAQTLLRTNSGEVPVAGNSSLADNNPDKDQEPQSGKGLASKLGRKPSVPDENRRATYNTSLEPETDSDSVLLTFEGESKQFIPVGLHAEHSYARSLARFAATLGSVAWKVASQSIEQALPKDVKFGRGWVGEYEPLSTPVLTPENCILKEPNFHSHSKIASDIREDRRTPKGLVDGTPHSHKLPLFVNPITAKQESPRVANKDHSPSLSPSPKPFFSSLQANPAFSSSNFLHQRSPSRNYTTPEKGGSPQVELNHPPPMHLSASDFVAKGPVSNASGIPSPRQSKPVKNEILAPLPSFKHPNSNIKGNPAPFGLDCNRTIPTDSVTRQQEPQALSDPVQLMKMLAQKGHHQQTNSNGFGFNLRRQESNNAASSTPHSHSNSSQIGSKRDDSSNVAFTAAQAWMSLGATGFLKPPSAENMNPHKQPVSSPDSLYSSSRDHHQPQVSRFRGELNTCQQPVYGFVPQPVRMLNDGQPQNRNVGFPQVVTTDLSRFQVPSSWRGVNPHMQIQSRPKQQESRPPDLNIGYQSMGSPVRQSTGMMVDSQQPDLALQL
uniref:uncharacterized protein LOC122611361 n=1 Tax=Erigeron canadensis TaxID=72917 RepID=UPI001CB8FB62|nr:uncharacterized protein LOC122611361 [Erigeron canadensis]